MPAAADRIEFAPPPLPGRLPAWLLAILAHVLLLLALTWGISWNRQSEDLSAEAELWSSVPREAAPMPATPPPPPAVQAPVPAPPPPAAEPKVEPPPAPKPPDIALEREKRKQQEAQRQREALEREKKIEAQKKQEELDRQKKLEARKQELEKKRQEDLAKAAKAQQEQQRLEALRKEQLERMQRLASSGSEDAKGTAERSAGPSSSYAGRVRARVRPNIVFTDDVPGNPMATVEVQLAPDGTIVSRRLTKSSGVPSWDEAVLRALDKTEVLPRDIDGRVPTPLSIDFKPKG